MEPGEELLLQVPIAHKLRNPLEMTPTRRTAYLTDSRLIIEKEGDYLYIPFEWMVGLNLVGLHNTEKAIKLEHGRKIRFSVHTKEALHERNRKTEKLYNWLHDLCNRPDKASSVIKEIKAARKFFQ